MGTGHTKKQHSKKNSQLRAQQSLFKTHWKHRLTHGGVLRQKKQGRGARPLSNKEPLHLVFKIDKARLRQRSLRTGQSFALTKSIIEKYAKKFHVRIEQLSIQGDHIHILLQAPKRQLYQNFFRLVAGQIAQRFLKEGLLIAISKKMTDTPSQQPLAVKSNGTKLWKYRPFTRVIRGWQAYRIVRDYVQLNEQEARGVIPYRKERLRGMSSQDWQLLWS